MAIVKPTFIPSIGAGTGATGDVTGEDSQGTITLVSGSLPALGAVIGSLVFGESFSPPPNGVILTPANDNASLMGINVWVPKSSIAAAGTGFDVKNVGVSLTGGLTYVWYFVIY